MMHWRILTAIALTALLSACGERTPGEQTSEERTSGLSFSEAQDACFAQLQEQGFGYRWSDMDVITFVTSEGGDQLVYFDLDVGTGETGTDEWLDSSRSLRFFLIWVETPRPGWVPWEVQEQGFDAQGNPVWRDVQFGDPGIPERFRFD